MVQNTRYTVVLEVFKSLQLSAATMGRRSKSKRKEKRKQQRYNKRTRKRLCKAHLSIQPSERAEQTTSPGLFLVSQPGSPSSQNQSATTFNSQLLPSYTQSELSSLFGSPSSPPPSRTISPSPLSTPLEAESPLANENDSTNILGIDSDAMVFRLNMELGFEKCDLGASLSGEELLDYLKETNLKLPDKVTLYQQKCEELERQLVSTKVKSQESIDSIRHFYRDMIFYGTSQGAKMLKASYYGPPKE